MALGAVALTIGGGVTLMAEGPPQIPLAPGWWWTGDGGACLEFDPCEWTDPLNWDWINSPLFPPIPYPSNSSEDVWISLTSEATIELAQVTVNQFEISLDEIDLHLTKDGFTPIPLACDHLKILSTGDSVPVILPVTITISDGASLTTVD
ncbi:MAG: hypothetical protein ACE5E5_12825 [Phycisphaerae bacterium]